jgi:AcrR family transcriptional regulator
MPKVTEAHVESRRQQIIQAACICISRKGFQETTMRDIFEAAELSAGAVYGYFSSKDDLLKAIAEEALRSNEALLNRMRRAEGARQRIVEFFRIVLDPECCPEPPVDISRMKVGLWAEAVRSPDVRAVAQRNYQTVVASLAHLVGEGQESGELRKGLDPTATAQILISLFEGLTLQRALDSTVDPDKYVDALLTLFDGSFWAGTSGESTADEPSTTRGAASTKE